MAHAGDDAGEEEIPVLGPEHEIREEIDEELPHARILEVASEADLSGLPVLEPEPEEPAVPSEDSRNYRAIYETRLRDLSPDARVELAHRAQGSELMALCLDADPHVIAAVFQNALAGLEHARFAALHHRNPAGHEHILKRAAFLRDPQVLRALLKNDQLSESGLRRLLGQKPLRELYRFALDREIVERNRVGARRMLHTRFTTAAPDERVELVVSTEGRCLSVLVGATFDGKTTAMLCARQYNSTVFVQNLARFPACPPGLLAHLMRQPFVQRSQALKRMLLQHPNMPSQVKRGL